MPFDQFKVNLDTPQPGGRQGESPRSAFTKYNDFLDAIALGEIVVGPNPPTETRAYGEWINTSTVPPMLMRRNGDNTDWVAIAPALAALSSLSGDNEFSGANSFTGDNEFSGANSFTGDNEFIGATLLASLLLGNVDTEIARAAAGQIDVNGSRVYQRNNIVGTVSQSGGLPTGGLVEYGSNENGEFWRYAGGMQICKSRRNLGDGPANTSVGNLFLGYTSALTFAAAFVSPPEVNLTVIEPQGQALNTYVYAAYILGLPTASSYFPVVISNRSLSNGPRVFSETAVGRWH